VGVKTNRKFSVAGRSDFFGDEGGNFLSAGAQLGAEKVSQTFKISGITKPPL
jgi:hypothetical protein